MGTLRCDPRAVGEGGWRRRSSSHSALVPEFDWWVPGMQQWLEQARERFAPGDDLDALWVTGRRTRCPPYLDRRFANCGTGRPVEGSDAAQPPAFTVTHLLEFGYAERFVQEQVSTCTRRRRRPTPPSFGLQNRVLAEALKALIERKRNDR